MILNVALLLITALASSLVFAGPRSGGGGFVVECQGNEVEPRTVQTLDLY